MFSDTLSIFFYFFARNTRLVLNLFPTCGYKYFVQFCVSFFGGMGFGMGGNLVLGSLEVMIQLAFYN